MRAKKRKWFSESQKWPAPTPTNSKLPSKTSKMDKTLSGRKILSPCSKNYSLKTSILNSLLQSSLSALTIYSISISTGSSRDSTSKNRNTVILTPLNNKEKKVRSHTKTLAGLRKRAETPARHLRSWTRRWGNICWHLNSRLKVKIMCMTRTSCLMMDAFDVCLILCVN